MSPHSVGCLGNIWMTMEEVVMVTRGEFWLPSTYCPPLLTSLPLSLPLSPSLPPSPPPTPSLPPSLHLSLHIPPVMEEALHCSVVEQIVMEEVVMDPHNLFSTTTVVLATTTLTTAASLIVSTLLEMCPHFRG